MVRPGMFRPDVSASLHALQSELQRLFEHYAPSWVPTTMRTTAEEGEAPAWVPAVDLYETPDAIELVADVPGVNAAGIELTVDGRVLTIRGEKPVPGAGQGARHCRERRYGRFLRHITLPSEVDIQAVRADVHEGVLEVHLPKVEAARIRQVPIQTA